MVLISATCHRALEAIQLLHKFFPGRVISRFRWLELAIHSKWFIAIGHFSLGFLSLRFMPTIPRPLASWWKKLSSVLMEFSHIYENILWKVLDKSVPDTTKRHYINLSANWICQVYKFASNLTDEVCKLNASFNQAYPSLFLTLHGKLDSYLFP